LDIEIEGVKQVKNSHLNAIFIFVEPPSIEELERRLRARNTETEESLEKRLNTARTELKYGLAPGNFDFVVHNNNLKEAYHKLRDYVLCQIERQVADGFNISLERRPLSDSDFLHD
jgi:guanylate kinase